MAKGRLLHRKISLDKDVNDLPIASALAFTWTIPHLDVEGRIHGDPVVLKSLVCPRRMDISSSDIEEFIQQWVAAEMVVLYEAEGDLWLWFPKFKEHQSGLRADREAPSFIPAPEEGDVCGGTPDQLRTNSGVTPEQLPSNSGVNQIKININKTNTERGSGGPEKTGPENVRTYREQYPEHFDAWCKAYPKHVEKVKAFPKWQFHIDSLVRPEELLTAAKNYAKVMRENGTEKKFIAMAHNFLDDKWREYLELNTAPARDGPEGVECPVCGKTVPHLIAGEGMCHECYRDDVEKDKIKREG